MCNVIAISVYSQSDMQVYETKMNQKEYQQAVYAITKVLKDKSQRSADAYFKRAKAYAALGNNVYAVADCTSALSFEPNYSKAFFLRGKCKFEIGDPTYLADMQNCGKEGIEYLKSKKVNVKNPPKTYVNINSDVDTNIPSVSFNTNNNTFVLIISNENYLEQNISSANFANKDGETFKQYCIKTLGIPEKNIHIRHDATRNQMRSEVKWMQNVAHVFGEKANMIVYYSGHGMPDEVSRKAYLLPADGIANDPESAYSLSSLYEQLGSMEVNNVIVLLDACFSGSQRNGEMLTSSKGIAIKPKAEVLKGKVVVLSASQGDETAYPYEEKGHGLFTYFLLKKMQESKGDTTLEELGDYIISHVSQTAIIKNGKNQIPTVNTSTTLLNTWRNIKLK